MAPERSSGIFFLLVVFLKLRLFFGGYMQRTIADLDDKTTTLRAGYCRATASKA